MRPSTTSISLIPLRNVGGIILSIFLLPFCQWIFCDVFDISSALLSLLLELCNNVFDAFLLSLELPIHLDLRLISSIFLRLSYRSFDALVSVFLMYSLNSTGHESKRFIFKLDAAWRWASERSRSRHNFGGSSSNMMNSRAAKCTRQHRFFWPQAQHGGSQKRIPHRYFRSWKGTTRTSAKIRPTPTWLHVQRQQRRAPNNAPRWALILPNPKQPKDDDWVTTQIYEVTSGIISKTIAQSIQHELGFGLNYRALLVPPVQTCSSKTGSGPISLYSPRHGKRPNWWSIPNGE